MTDMVSLWVGERLLIGSIQALVLVTLVWLACRLFRRIPAAAQAALWWLVALKLVLVFAPVPAVPVPVLPDFIRSTGPPFLERPAVSTNTAGVKSTAIGQIAQPSTVASAFRRKSQMSDAVTPVFRALILFWLIALLLQAARLVLAHRHLRGIVSRSRAWPGDEMSGLAARVGLRHPPQVLMSDEIDSPQVFGLWSPVVLLPAETMTALSEAERTMTLCHELMHIRRHDLLFGWVPACAERLFFFHPLARLSAREYVAARESACDAAAVRALDVPAGDYGRMLVRLGIGNARPALSVGGSPFSTSSLKRRLEMLETRRLSTLSPRWRWALAVLAAMVIPMQLVARTPEAPHARPAVTVTGTVTTTTPFDGHSLEIENAELQFEENGERFQIEAEKLKVEKLKTKIEGELEKENDVVLKVAKLVEQARDVQEKAERADVEEMMALIAKARENVELNADKAKLVEALARRMQELEVARAQEQGAERQPREVVRAPQVTQQQRLERLLAQLERLAAEQRQLLEEIRQLQQQPRK